MRILLYSHDTYGLGHIQRTLKVARQLSRDLPRVSQLLITGSLQANAMALPPGLDYIKLPSTGKRSNGEYHSRVLSLPFDTIKTLRESILLETARYFEPNLVLVDKAPAGMEGELLPALRYLKAHRPATKLVLGLRDIEDRAARVCADWTRQGIYPLLDEVYDAILLYGRPEIYDPVREYHLPPHVAEKVIACGYIGDEGPPVRPSDQVRRELNVQTDRLVVVTTGGGGDGFDLVYHYLEMLRAYSKQGGIHFDSLVTLGPQMKSEQRQSLQHYKRLGLPLTMIDFTTDLRDYLHAADVVVSMGGYNSVFEILSLCKWAIIVPRVKTREEQWIRAERLAAMGLLKTIHPDDLTPARLFEEIHGAFEAGEMTDEDVIGLDLNGAVNASRAIAQLLAVAEPVSK